MCPIMTAITENCLARAVQTLDSAIHRINHYPVDSVIDFRNTYPLGSAIQRLNNRGQVIIMDIKSADCAWELTRYRTTILITNTSKEYK